MRIGEVAVISRNGYEKESFIQAICKNIEIKNETLSFGRFDVNDQLSLHLYGISVKNDESSLSWDLISRKALGYVIIFDWDDPNMLDETKNVIDHFSDETDAPIIIVANIKGKKQPPIPKKFFQQKGIQLSANSRFIFGHVDDPHNSKKILKLLVNMLIERLS